MRKGIEKIFAVVMLLYATAALSQFIEGTNDPLARAEGNLIAIGIQIGLYCVALFFIATRWQPFLQGILKIKWIALLLALAVKSRTTPNPRPRTQKSLCPSLSFRALLLSSPANLLRQVFLFKLKDDESLHGLLFLSQPIKRVQDLYNLSVPSVLISNLRLPTVPQNQ
jgi:hypothetical protein